MMCLFTSDMKIAVDAYLDESTLQPRLLLTIWAENAVQVERPMQRRCAALMQRPLTAATEK